MTQDSHSSEPADLSEEASAFADAAEMSPVPARKTAPRAPPRRPATTEPETTPLQPSWLLSGSGEQLTRDELLARYRRQRSLPEDPFENEPVPEPPHGYRHSMMRERHGARFKERARASATPPRPKSRSFTVMQTLAIATATALVAGGSAGVLSARLLSPQATAPAVADAAGFDVTPAPPSPKLQMTSSSAAHDTIVEKKPVSTATLQVADVSGETNSFIPLALQAAPAGLETDMLLKISGLPEGAYLTSGHRQDDQIWALSLAELKGVKLVVPRADDPQIDLAVAAFEPRTGELAAPVKTMTVALTDVVVEPASAPPPDLHTTPPASVNTNLPASNPPHSGTPMAVPESAETQNLINGADALLSGGDVAAARRSYERAWGNDGSAAAAFGLAQSYDPLVQSTLPATNAAPDKGLAMQWYQRAATAGHADAAKAIIQLQMN